MLFRQSSRVSDFGTVVSNMTSKIKDVEVDDIDAARALGWASIGIGLAEIAAPRHVQNLLGLEDNAERRGILRVLGVRELGHGVTLLTEDKPTKYLSASAWSRVAGDVLDTALLARAATKTKSPTSFTIVS